MKKKTRAEISGELFANGIVEAAHLSYKASRGRQMIGACIQRLQERIDELQPKKTDPAYKKARYGKK